MSFLGPQIVRDNVKLGKFGALIKVEAPDIDLIAGELCQHVIGMNPREIGTPEPPKVEKKMSKKKKKEEAGEEVTKEKQVEEEDESQLLRQEFILDPSLTVHNYLAGHAPKVVDFVRFECGEVLPGDED